MRTDRLHVASSLDADTFRKRPHAPCYTVIGLFLAVLLPCSAPAQQPYSGSPIPIPGIWEVENFDLGGEAVAYHDLSPGNQGGQYRVTEDVDVFVSNDSAGGAFIVKNFEGSEWMGYTIDVPMTGQYDVEVRAATNPQFPGRAYHIEVDGVNVTGTVVLSTTDEIGWADFQWLGKRNVNLNAGTHFLKVVSEVPYFSFNTMRMTWSCGFESSWTDCEFFEQAKTLPRASLVTFAREGTSGMRLHTEPGDDEVAGSGPNERNDLQLSPSDSYCSEGQEEWWAHSILFPSDYVDPPESTETTWNWAVVFDFHQSGTGGGQANFQVHAMPATAIHPARPTGLSFSVFGGVPAAPAKLEYVPIGPVFRNVWYDFVYHIKWSSNPAVGFVKAWVRTADDPDPTAPLLLDYTGPNLYVGQSCYLKLANYHSPFGQPSSVIHDRVIRGTTPGAVSLTALEAVPGW